MSKRQPFILKQYEEDFPKVEAMRASEISVVSGGSSFFSIPTYTTDDPRMPYDGADNDPFPCC